MVDFKNFLSSNSDALVQLGAGLLSGKTASEQLGGGLSGFAQGRKQMKAQNATLGWLQQNDPELGQLMASGAISPTDAFKLAYEKRMQSQKPKNYDFQTLPDGTYGSWDPTTGQFNPLGSAPKAGAGGGTPTYGNNPIYGKDAQGNIIILQPGDNGTLAQPQIPEGVKILGPGDKAFDAAQGKTLGGSAGDAQVSLPYEQQQTQELIRVADEVINDPNLANAVGPIDSQLPTFRPGTANVEAKIAQLRGGAFLAARKALKGGGQITDIEGQKAEDALLRASMAQDETSFKQALTEFKTHLQTGLSILQQKAGAGGQYGQPGGSAAGRTSSGISFTVEP